MAEREFDGLYARLDDLCSMTARGELGITDFLSLRELYFARKYLDGRAERYSVFGGYDGAERCRVYLLPDYIPDDCPIPYLSEYGFEPDVCALRLKTDGYRHLEHRDYLGSLLGLGVERAVIGDILVLGEDGASAIVFCTSAIADFFISEPRRVASERVRVTKIPFDEIEVPTRRTLEISDTVASARLDCVIGAICSLSRDKAKALICAGLVQVDFELQERPDRSVVAPAVISVRGYGRYTVLSLSELTRKGRIRLRAEKFL